MLRGIERVLGLFAGLSGPAIIAFVSFQVYQTTECSYPNPCTTTSHSDWQDHPALTVAVLLVTAVLGLGLAALVYRHSVSTSGRLLLEMWLSVPVLVALTAGLAFTWMGLAAECFAFGMLLASLAGSAVQLGTPRPAMEPGPPARTTG